MVVVAFSLFAVGLEGEVVATGAADADADAAVGVVGVESFISFLSKQNNEKKIFHLKKSANIEILFYFFHQKTCCVSVCMFFFEAIQSNKKQKTMIKIDLLSR